MTRIFLVRHGETLWEGTGRYLGHTDIPLSPRGKAQAERLGERLAGEKVNVIYASDLLRAQETAQVLSRGWGLTPRLRPQLRENHFGLWQGLTHDEIRQRYPEELRQREKDPLGFAPPQGENLASLAARVDRARQEMVQEAGPVLLVSHAGPLKVLLCLFLGLPLPFYWRLRLDHASLSILDTYPEGAILSLLNSTSHLEGLQAPSQTGR